MRDLNPQLAMLGLVVYASPALIHLWRTHRITVLLLVLAVVGGAVGSVLRFVTASREVIRGGWSASDVRRALERMARVAREEAESVGENPEFTPEPKEASLRRARLWQRAGHYSVAAGVTAAATVGVVNPHELSSTVLGIGMFVVVFGALTYGAAYELRRRAGSAAYAKSLQFVGWTERLLATRFTDVLFRLAGKGLQTGGGNEPPAAERTELLLAAGATDVWTRLSPHLRARFERVPDVLKRLERDVQALREREQKLAHALLVQDSPDLQRSRQFVQERLATTVAALESIRLDLLRLEAGAASADDLTANIARAAEIAGAIDAQLYGQAAAEDAIRTPA